MSFDLLKSPPFSHSKSKSFPIPPCNVVSLEKFIKLDGKKGKEANELIYTSGFLLKTKIDFA